jgi:hypothetical protein
LKNLFSLNFKVSTSMIRSDMQTLCIQSKFLNNITAKRHFHLRDFFVFGSNVVSKNSPRSKAISTWRFNGENPGGKLIILTFFVFSVSSL